MKKFKWFCASCGRDFFADQDAAQCPLCGSDWMIMPIFNGRRVHGDHYEPYKGNGRWHRLSNDALATMARDNWLRKSRF
jgi:DNA-directed RNA polymerase subunit RPC12/RpoP